ncbi:nicotinamide/nicotinic acid mononucleotide adenylyltransferase isoform X2 [Amborella trichopoda]|uniref:nicotinamide/nicotinic acid mononucleotide adenylyltransferase isoform X2 n=1 Tax=Amborella trichopoda TaxID=13333 RepID=UPI0005D36557|nr:nicotinamide/nicotinic acid mononucleotide adenylyltransferase isoform X2 [Amborella trichopoda]|eukprot:XP_011629399.1 nicotinamide/nicotinic acid mononucleotide adenylyltransferase isoform X2 [Amborella trichopoda]
MDIPLPLDKISFQVIDQVVPTDVVAKKRTYVVLVSTGSFNPPTYMHLRMFELARDALNSEGYVVIGAYMSPVNDAYKKKAKQSSYQRTLTVLDRIQGFLHENRIQLVETLKVMLLCGSDLLESFGIPGAWIRDQVRTICRDYGVVSIRREGQDIDKIIDGDDILFENKNNVIVVDELIPNKISSTRVREIIKRRFSLKYLTADGVIDYIDQHQLYRNEDELNS